MIRPPWASCLSLALRCRAVDRLKQDYDRFHAITVGMTEQAVRGKLGEPVHVHEKATAPKDYYVRGYSFKERPITHKVLIHWIGTDCLRLF
jgi:hypothetical protein